MKHIVLFLVLSTGTSLITNAQQPMKPEETEIWEPVPPTVTPGKSGSDAPSDAIILFDGKNLDQWVSSRDTTAAANWTISDGVITVKKGTGNIQTRQSFQDYQLHLEWRIPQKISGAGQARGNSGLFLASLGAGDAGYELQILDSYNNKTYVNGQAASIYKQFAPMSNPIRPPGSWQTYDILWTAPRFNDDGSLKSPALVTVLFNGALVHYNTELKGATVYTGKPSYKKHGASPLKLQDHGDKSEPISLRNIWIRPL